MKRPCREIVDYFQDYIDSYDVRYLRDKNTLIHDILYGLGMAIDPEEYRWADGYEEFKSYLKGIL